VTRVDYIHNRPVRRIFAMIVASWAISAVISIPPLFGWKTPDNDPDLTGICLISQVRRHATRPLKGAVHVLYNALGVGEGGVEILLYCVILGKVGT